MILKPVVYPSNLQPRPAIPDGNGDLFQNFGGGKVLRPSLEARTEFTNNVAEFAMSCYSYLARQAARQILRVVWPCSAGHRRDLFQVNIRHSNHSKIFRYELDMNPIRRRC
jgi:hypothetical protein